MADLCNTGSHMLTLSEGSVSVCLQWRNVRAEWHLCFWSGHINYKLHSSGVLMFVHVFPCWVRLPALSQSVKKWMVMHYASAVLVGRQWLYGAFFLFDSLSFLFLKAVVQISLISCNMTWINDCDEHQWQIQT